MKLITKLINIFIQTGLRLTDSDQLKSQKQFLNSIGILMWIGGFSFGVVCVIFGIDVVAYIPLPLRD